jgi:hypothetical protein
MEAHTKIITDGDGNTQSVMRLLLRKKLVVAGIAVVAIVIAVVLWSDLKPSGSGDGFVVSRMIE